ncbi:MAG: threonylcarbamoyl-AMP synthase, partial [Armatimonadetes bacterium]|nr:threonylcarbamoyl-AMP synthase [Armatimonadota bacterium]
RSPGQMLRHYAPKKPTILVRTDDNKFSMHKNKFSMHKSDALLVLPDDPNDAATVLYAELRRLDGDEHVGRIVIVEPPDGSEWEAIHDRLRRAASPAR